jgi:hypothetical protein
MLYHVISTVIKRALVWLVITGASVPVVRTPGPGDIESAFQFGNVLSFFFHFLLSGLTLVYHQFLRWSQASNQAGRSISLSLSLFLCFLRSGGPQRSCWPRVHGIGAIVTIANTVSGAHAPPSYADRNRVFITRQSKVPAPSSRSDARAHDVPTSMDGDRNRHGGGDGGGDGDIHTRPPIGHVTTFSRPLGGLVTAAGRSRDGDRDAASALVNAHNHCTMTVLRAFESVNIPIIGERHLRSTSAAGFPPPARRWRVRSSSLPVPSCDSR